MTGHRGALATMERKLHGFLLYWFCMAVVTYGEADSDQPCLSSVRVCGVAWTWRRIGIRLSIGGLGEEEVGGEDAGGGAGEVGEEGVGDGVAGSFDADGAEVDGEDVEHCVGASLDCGGASGDE